MRFLTCLGVALLCAAPSFGTTYYGGVEDWTGLDYDYNDVVFSLSGNGLSLNTSTGKWFSEPALGTSGAPFWNNSSLDTPGSSTYNIGYCIYGGGCGGRAGLAPGVDFLASNATSTTGSANDVTFSASGQVQLSVAFQVTDARDVMGWYSLSTPNSVHWLNTDSSDGSFSFNPGGTFGLVEQSLGQDGQAYTYYSQTQYGSADDVSHFAFFGSPATTAAPEPGAIGMIALGLIGSGWALRRAKSMAV